MDETSIHLGNEPRRFPGLLPVWHVYWLPGKRQRIRHTYQTCNCSLLLAGSGVYRHGDAWLPVRAPCVLTQWRGQPVDYGPDATWDEFAVRYAGNHADAVARIIGYEPREPVYPVAWTAASRAAWGLLTALLATDPRADVDRFDRAVECLLLSLRERRRDRDPVAIAEDLLSADLAAPGDLDAVAGQLGISTAHLRRLWRARHDCAPGVWRERRRLAEACRLLLDHDLAIGAVAAAVGYHDPLYFSRRFRLATGVSPSRWRDR